MLYLSNYIKSLRQFYEQFKSFTKLELSNEETKLLISYLSIYQLKKKYKNTQIKICNKIIYVIAQTTQFLNEIYIVKYRNSRNH